MNICIDKIIEIIRENKDKIKNHLKGLKRICLVTDNLDFSSMNELGDRLLKGKTKDTDFLSLNENGLRILDMTDDIFNELRVLIPKDVEILILPGAAFKINGKKSDFPCLKEFISSTFLNLRENNINEELNKIIRMDFPKTGKLGELFSNSFIVSYFYAAQVSMNRVEIFDKRLNDEDLFSSNIITFSLDSAKEISSVRIEKLDFEEIVLFLEWLKAENYKVGDITLVLENRTIPGIEIIEKYLADFNILIDYKEFKKTSYEDFMAMRATIDWYKEIIMSSEMSPFEILIFAYDILKTFNYKEGENSDDSRFVPNIIQTGNIVCVGYSKLLQMIINELNIKSVDLSIEGTKDEAGHQRVAVRLDDSKYDIHGVFAVDATWDRGIDELSLVLNSKGQQVIRRTGKKSDDKVIKEYDALSLYNYFMIPFSDYQKIFWDEKLPDIFKIFDKNIGYDYDYFDCCRLEFKRLFGNLDKNYIKNYIYNSKKPSLEKFREALSVVRKAEGYIESEISEIVDDTIELNKMLDESDVFFKEEFNKK